ncbi:MAG: hypothetical protein QMD05_04445, partial [Candidatus Brocadiaceae bacterium]|nr:hypothetical protein [Candidatus Brocadiaceae bacterium]
KSEGANCIQQTSDGGYIVAGETNSFGNELGDAWVLKLALDGTVEWQKTYGGDIFGKGHCIRQTSDGGYIVAGWIVSHDEEWGDARVLKLATDGMVEWQKTYGEDSLEGANSIQATRDGGYIVAGRTYFFGAGGADIWVLKLRPSGSIKPSCHFIRDTRVSVMDTSARVIDTNAVIRDSDAKAKDSSATVQDTGVSARFLVK